MSAKPFGFLPIFSKGCWSMLVAALAFAGGIFSASAQKISLRLDPSDLDAKSLLDVISATSAARPYDQQSPAEIPTLLALLSAVEDKARDTNDETRDELESRRQELKERLRKIVLGLDEKALHRLAFDRTNARFSFFRFELMRRSIEQEVSRILHEPKLALVFPEEPPKLPERFTMNLRLGAEMREYTRAIAPFAQLVMTASKTPRGLSADGNTYDKMEELVWRGGRKKLADDLLRFSWDSFCGVGSDSFFQQQAEAVLLSLLRERRIAEALGASFSVEPMGKWLWDPAKPLDKWRFDLAKYCGFDGETLLLAIGQRDVLAGNCSERAARQSLSEMQVKWAKKEDIYKSDWEELASFLPPGSALRNPGTDIREKLPMELQKDILTFLKEAIRADVSFHELESNLAIFARLERPETKPILREVVGRPSRRYAERAARILRAMGEDLPPIAPDPPIRFRVFLNGEPWGFQEISYGPQIKTDAEGFAQIPRDFFFDQANTASLLTFSCVPQSEEGREDQQYAQPWIAADCAKPIRFDETIHVDCKSAPLTVEIDYFVQPLNPARASTVFRLMKADKTGLNDWSYRVDFGGYVSAPRRLAFTTLQPDHYRLLISAPGSAHWLSDPIDVQPGTEPLRVKLEQGSDLYASIVAPANARGVGSYQLLQNGTDVSERFHTESFQDHKPLFAGLPKGDYVFRTLSTKEHMEKNRITEWHTQSGPGGKPREWVDCDAVTINFTIDKMTPALLDLGRIEIPVSSAMREKAEALREISHGAPQDG